MAHVRGHDEARRQEAARQAERARRRREDEQREKKVVRPLDSPLPKSSEFRRPDGPEGMQSASGGHMHGGLDWFAKGGSPVKSPVDGKVVGISPSRGNSGQVFGGVVKVQDTDGRVFVFRHVDPTRLKEGQTVKAGQQIAHVTAWQGGSSHAHIEVWKSLEGGYRFENAIDPLEVFRNGKITKTMMGPGSEGTYAGASVGGGGAAAGAVGGAGAVAPAGGAAAAAGGVPVDMPQTRADPALLTSLDLFDFFTVRELLAIAANRGVTLTELLSDSEFARKLMRMKQRERDTFTSGPGGASSATALRGSTPSAKPEAATQTSPVFEGGDSALGEGALASESAGAPTGSRDVGLQSGGRADTTRQLGS